MGTNTKGAGFLWRVMGFFNRAIANRNFRFGIMPAFVLMLTTSGRRSGQPRQTLLQYDPYDGGYGVASARGVEADWYRNIEANSRVTIQLKKQSPQAAVAEAVSEPGRVADFLLHRLEKHPRMIARMLRAEGCQPPYTREKMVAFCAGKAMVILRLA